MTLKNKRVLVTGAARGIGRAIAFCFAKEGCHVFICTAKSKDALACVQKEIHALGAPCEQFLCDVSDYVQCCDLFERIGCVDILINNAGISHIGLFTDMQPQQWMRILQVNLLGAMHCTHIALPPMIRQKEGSIINISSMWGERGASCEAVYAASKGGLNAFTKSIAKEVGPSGIRCNAIACGVIETQMNAQLTEEARLLLQDEISLMRFGTPQEVGQAALFLAGEASAFINGQILTIDGGMF